jgi:ATP-dependent DNA ligase
MGHGEQPNLADGGTVGGRNTGRRPVAYEPKWDGFRCLLACDGEKVTMTSKSGKGLTRYFPEVANAAVLFPERRFVLDGELVVQMGGEFSFDTLLQRIRPAASRIKRLSLETPALFLAFDLLKRGKADLMAARLPKRRHELEEFAARCFPRTLFRLSPASRKLKDARKWLRSAGGGSDGIIAKRVDLPQPSGQPRWHAKDQAASQRRLRHWRFPIWRAAGSESQSRRLAPPWAL